MSKILQVVAVFLLLFGTSDFGFSQDKILTMSGKVIPCKIIDDTQVVINYTITTKNDKVKTRMIHKSEVFSIIKGGEENVLYAKDDVLGDTFTVAETRDFITGETDGYNYNTKRIEVIGYVLGTAGGYLSKANFIVVLLTPTLYTIYQYIPYIKIKEETMSDLKFKGNKNYLRGYEVNARGKRVRKALNSSLVGSVFGAIIFELIPYS